MTSRPRVLFRPTLGAAVLTALLGFALAAAPASGQRRPPAQSSLAESLTGSARSDYDAGRILFMDGDYAGALIKFQSAFQSTPDLRLLWNMAACEKNQRHYGSALELLERYRRDGDALMSPTHREEVAAVISTLRTLVSTVHLSVSEVDARVFVDERHVGTTPLGRPLYIDLGSRRLRVSKPGFEDLVITQDFNGGSELTLMLTMAPESREAELTVMTDANSRIHIDGRAVGHGRWQGSLLAGRHTLRVSAPDMVPHVQELVIEAGQPRTVYIQLKADESGGVPAWIWMGAGVLTAGALATGAYFLLRTPAAPDNTPGTWSPNVVYLPLQSSGGR